MIRTEVTLLVFVAVLLILALALGDQKILPEHVLGALLGNDQTPVEAVTIVRDLRLPRALMAVLVGAALATAGALSQAILRNPLAEPGLLGINAGAALAAVIVIIKLDIVSAYALPFLTFAGALVMSAAIYALAWREGTSSLNIILIGVGLSALAGAAAQFIAVFGEIAALQRAMVWLAGSLQDSRWIKVQTLLIWLVIPFAAVWMASRELDLIALGDDVAAGLGQPVEWVRGLMVLACAVISGAAVASAGLVAFVGLAAPHLARRLVGRRHHRLIPAAALMGGLMVLAADIVARQAMPPLQLPVGLVTAMLGAPFFGFLLWRRRHD